MEEASLLIGHNILGFDLPALEKLFGWTLPKTVNLHDTLIMSQVQNYKRFGNDGHSLRRWGEFFGFPKETLLTLVCTSLKCWTTA